VVGIVWIRSWVDSNKSTFQRPHKGFLWSILQGALYTQGLGLDDALVADVGLVHRTLGPGFRT